MSETGPDHVEEIALGLARRIAEIRRAEEQLAAFAWHEDDPGADVLEAEEDARHLLLRALHVATESGMYHLLERLVRDGDVALAELAETLSLPRLAVVDRVSALTQAGLASRELESDRVGATRLGRGVVSMLETVSGAVKRGAGE